MKKASKQFIWAMLVVLALILSIILLPIGLIGWFGIKKWGEYWRNLAISIDQTAGVFYAPVLNLLFFRGAKLGNPDHTISMVIGLNYKSNTLTWIGFGLWHLLELLDKNHSIDAIEV